MSDMDDINESPETVEQSPGLFGRGTSRRDMIKMSVAAGALVWTAPVLLTGKAAAASTTPCCPDGTPVTFKISSATATNCGSGCLDNIPTMNFSCNTTLATCLLDPRNGFVVGDFTSGGADTATIILKPGVTLIAAAVKAASVCYYTVCPCFTNSQADSTTCKNTCAKESGGGACSPPPTIPPNRIWVLANTNGNVAAAGYTTIKVNTHASPDGQLNYVHLSLCLAPAVTGICP